MRVATVSSRNGVSQKVRLLGHFPAGGGDPAVLYFFAANEVDGLIAERNLDKVDLVVVEESVAFVEGFGRIRFEAVVFGNTLVWQEQVDAVRGEQDVDVLELALAVTTAGMVELEGQEV